MTNELEKKFFDTFGIEATQKCAKPLLKTTSGFCNAYKNCIGCDYNDLKYPQITDRILLKLICILGNTSYFLITDDGLPIDVDGLKKSVLHSLTLQAKVDKNKALKHKVRTLFEEK